MPVYHRQGELPNPKHTAFRAADGERLYREELFSTKGFAGIYSTKYHLRLPPQVERIEERAGAVVEPWPEAPHQYVHFLTEHDAGGGSFLSGRRWFLRNDHVAVGAIYPTEPTVAFYRNARAHELIFVHRGSGRLRSEFGRLDFGPGDYLVCPKGSTYHLDFDGWQDNKCLVVESGEPFDIPRHYRNDYGQLLEHAPYSERDLRAPVLEPPRDEDGAFVLVLKVGERWFHYTLPHHPFDVVGWDGYVYPYAFNIRSFNPAVGRVHLPPPVHLVWATPHLAICNFVPRLYDFHPDAIPAPYFHSNVDSDEVIYYVEGEFMSRKGIEQGSITLHPMGIPHGPQPGRTEDSIGRKDTREYAVMIDTFEPLELTREVERRLDPGYPRSWLEE
ncbi:MAG: homogentisate 1,2-dioxygenase [bacterium]